MNGLWSRRTSAARRAGQRIIGRAPGVATAGRRRATITAMASHNQLFVSIATAASLGFALTLSSAAKADVADQTKCSVAAFMEYNKATLPMVRSGETSVETKLLQRRLAEAYCLKWIRCFTDTPASAQGDVFAACLNGDDILK
jgi:hypothetical protein